MPEPKSAFDATYPCDFYEPAELFEPEQMYTIPEIGRLLQGLEPDAEVDPDTEAVLVDWAVPWVMVHAEEMVVAEPLSENGPGYYGLATDSDPEPDPDTEDDEADADESA
jgi:hypothetical protein